MDKVKFFTYAFGCNPEDITEEVIITPVIPVKKFAKNCSILEEFRGKIYSGTIFDKNGVKFTVLNCLMGSLFAGDAILLLDITKSKRILFSGICGGLNDCKIGDLIIADKAFDEIGRASCRERV